MGLSLTRCPWRQRTPNVVIRLESQTGPRKREDPARSSPLQAQEGGLHSTQPVDILILDFSFSEPCKNRDRRIGVSRCKLLHIGWINEKVLLYSSGNYIQYPVINQNGKEYKKNTYICITESLCHTAEINTTQHNKVKNLPAMPETWVWFLDRKNALEKEMATHSCIPAWRIPGTEEPGGLQPMCSQRVGHDCVILHTHTYSMQIHIYCHSTCGVIHCKKKKKATRKQLFWQDLLCNNKNKKSIKCLIHKGVHEKLNFLWKYTIFRHFVIGMAQKCHLCSI